MSKIINTIKTKDKAPTLYCAHYSSPFARIELKWGANGLFSLEFVSACVPAVCEGKVKGVSARSFVVAMRKELDAYFNGSLTVFDIDLELIGTPFQLRVWKELSKLPRATLSSYSQIARNIGSPTAARAVAGACSANPLPIIIPCHRVISASGAIGGYSAGYGVKLKRELLRLEGVDI